MATENNNNGLYLIVGLLIAVVLIMGFYMLNKDDSSDAVQVIEGMITGTDGDPDGFELSIDDDGFSGTIKDTE